MWKVFAIYKSIVQILPPVVITISSYTPDFRIKYDGLSVNILMLRDANTSWFFKLLAFQVILTLRGTGEGDEYLLGIYTEPSTASSTKDILRSSRIV